MNKQEQALERLKIASLNGDMDHIKEITRDVLEAGVSPYDAVTKGIAAGLQIAGDQFEHKQYFLADLMVCAEATRISLEVLEPLLKAEQGRFVGNVVIGVVEGDVHDIGKSIVAAMLRSAGFNVVDIGVDVPSARFVEKAKEVNADIVASGAFLSPVRAKQKEIEDLLRQAGIRGKVKTLVGGAVGSDGWAREIGADAYAPDAAAAVRVAKALMVAK